MANNINAEIASSSRRWGINPNILRALLKQESGFREGARSGAGAQDIAQFMPQTARAYGVTLGDNRTADDINGAAHYLRDNLNRTGGNYHAALSIYNSGRPDAYRDPHFAGGQTYNYVRTILGNAHTGGAPSAGAAPALAGGGAMPSETITKFDSAGYQDARRKAILGQYLAKRNPNNPLLRFGVVGTQAPDPEAFKTTEELGGLTGAKLAGGIAARGYSPTSAALIQHITDNINRVNAQHLPYKWGGGHGAKPQTPGDGVPIDCSGFVSEVTGITPRVSGDMGSIPGAKPGRGRVNIYYNGTHTFMEVNGHFAGTSGTNPGGGAGWIPRSAISPQYLKNFKVVHLD